MNGEQAARTLNRYCQRLGVPPPDLAVALARSETTLVHLMGLALLEAGGPMSLGAIAERLGRLPLPPRLATAAQPAALAKAWHGQAPLVRDPADGLLYLDLLDRHEVRWLAFIADPVRNPLVRPSPEQSVQPPDTEPLSQEEVDAAFRGRRLGVYSAVSLIRCAAAILDAGGGGALPLEEISRRLEALAGRSGTISEQTAGGWRSSLVAVTPDGLVHLDRSAPDAPSMRRGIRKMAFVTLRQRAESRRFRASQAEHEARRAEEARRDAAEARRARRALLHVVSVDGAPRAAALVDGARREVRTFIGDRLAKLPAALEAFDFLAGLDLRPSLRALGLDPDRWWLADLRPRSRTFRPTDRGAAIPITVPAVVQATTGKRGVPAEKKAWKKALEEASTRRLEAMLRDEAAALFALLEYGALHGGVRLRRKASDRLLPVAWSLAGDPDIEAILLTSARRWVPVQIVLGASPDLADPWPSAITASVVERDRFSLFVREGGEVRAIDPADIRAVRIPDPAAAASVPSGSHLFSKRDARRCRLRITLDGIEPPIWRRIEVPADITLGKLHAVIQAALGWTNSHLHMFEVGDERIGIPYTIDQLYEGPLTRSGRLVKLADVIDHGHRRFGYEYDFGDSWEHTIEVEEVLPERDAGGNAGPWALCLDGARACPPEDCGGIGGYAEMLEILFDPRHAEFDRTREWVGPDFEPERFDLDEVNGALAGISQFGRDEALGE